MAKKTQKREQRSQWQEIGEALSILFRHRGLLSNELQRALHQYVEDFYYMADPNRARHILPIFVMLAEDVERAAESEGQSFRQYAAAAHHPGEVTYDADDETVN